jgi:Fur family ferric uptake transcriptional regulator
LCDIFGDLVNRKRGSQHLNPFFTGCATGRRNETYSEETGYYDMPVKEIPFHAIDLLSNITRNNAATNANSFALVAKQLLSCQGLLQINLRLGFGLVIIEPGVVIMERKTTQKKAIEQVLRKYDRPLGVEDILQYGRKIVASLNQATVYRNLKLLVEGGWIKQINHPLLGTMYELTEKGHHHHFHCHACNRVYELPGCTLREDKVAPDGFLVEDHEVFLYGICPSCLRV